MDRNECDEKKYDGKSMAELVAKGERAKGDYRGVL